LELPSSKNDTALAHNFVQTTIENIEDIKYKNTDISPARKKAGGDCQKGWVSVCSRNSESQQFYENIDKKINKISNPDRVRKVKKNGLLNSINIENFRIPRKVDPKDFQTVGELMERCKYWWINRYRKDSDTWRGYENLLRDMACHKVFPVDLFDPKPNQVIAQLDYEEAQWLKKRDDKRDREGDFAIINRWKAIKALMRSYGRLREVKDNWNYTPPPAPKPKLRLIPSPKIAYQLTHYDYSKDPYENALYQYLLMMSLHIGFRPASELSVLRVSDIDLETGMIAFYQPKVETWRYLSLKEDIVNYPTRKCFNNWIYHWRPKVENQYSKDYMFIQPNGKPFTEAYLTKKLRQMAKKVWPQYYPYSTRHWCATAYLIKTKVENGVYGIKETCDFMNHSSFKVTEEYVKTATRWHNVAPYDWFRALLRFQTQNDKYKNHEFLKQQKGLRRIKSIKAQNGGLSIEIPPVERYGPGRIKTLFLLSKKLIKTENRPLSIIFGVKIHVQFSIFTLSFFFFYKNQSVIIFICVFLSSLNADTEIPYNFPYQYYIVNFPEVGNAH